jgi:uncharacterized membrane protein
MEINWSPVQISFLLIFLLEYREINNWLFYICFKFKVKSTPNQLSMGIIFCHRGTAVTFSLFYLSTFLRRLKIPHRSQEMSSKIRALFFLMVTLWLWRLDGTV